MYRWLLLYVTHWLIDWLLLNTHEYHVLTVYLTREKVYSTQQIQSLYVVDHLKFDLNNIGLDHIINNEIILNTFKIF